jgi:transcriptional regulator with XRE-family HTH domain
MNMKRIRKINNISQDELAHRSGLHRTYIGSVERGERNLTLRNAEVIAKALSTTLADLLSND